MLRDKSYTDKLTLTLMGALLIFGVTVLFNVTYREHLPLFSFGQTYIKQSVYIVIAFLVGLSFRWIDKKEFDYKSGAVYLVTLFFLILVLIIGDRVNGAKSWIRIGGFGFQPAEFAKIGVSLLLASYISQAHSVQSYLWWLRAMMIIAIPVFLILLEPDAGSALIYCTLVVALFRFGLNPVIPWIALIFIVVFIATLLLNHFLIFLIFIGLCIYTISFYLRYPTPRLVFWGVLVLSAAVYLYPFFLEKAELKAQTFINNHKTLAEKESARTEIPATVFLLVAAEKTDFGKNEMLERYHNPFGLGNNRFLYRYDSKEEAFQNYAYRLLRKNEIQTILSADTASTIAVWIETLFPTDENTRKKLLALSGSRVFSRENNSSNFIKTVLSGNNCRFLYYNFTHHLVWIGSIAVMLVLLPLLVWTVKQRSNGKIRTLLLLSYILVSINASDFFYNEILQQHQKDRIDIVLGIKEDIKNRGYNVHQSKIAVGSGGFWGNGWEDNFQTKGKFVPKQSTDFIFTAIGDIFGFVGTTLFLLCYLGLIFRLMWLADKQKSLFNIVFGYCIICLLFFQMLLNVAMTIGIFPTIGVPLPFISYGGSSVLTSICAIFIFLRLDDRPVL